MCQTMKFFNHLYQNEQVYINRIRNVCIILMFISLCLHYLLPPVQETSERWMTAELVNTVYEPPQLSADIVLSTRDPELWPEDADGFSQVFFKVPGLGDGQRVYQADVDPTTLLEIERDRSFEVLVRTVNGLTAIVSSSDVKVSPHGI